MQMKFKNGKFRIMQVSDPQDLKWVRHTMVYMLNKAYDDLKPDLVVLTGDNILGNHLCDARFGSKIVIKTKEGEFESLKTALDKVLAPIEKRKIPFAMIYGNHDDWNRITKDEQADIYRSYNSNIGLDGKEGGDCDTYNIPIYSEDGEKIKFNLWMLDSAWYDKKADKCYQYVKPQAVEWYINKSTELKKLNGGEPVPSLMFQHIPMLEILELLEECNKYDIGAVEGPDSKFYRLNSKKAKGVMAEYPSPVNHKTGQLEAIKKCGDVKAVIFGHDHPNCFEGVTDEGLRLIQTSCASFRCYGGRVRGVRIFDLDEGTGDFETKFYTYTDICGNTLTNELRFIWDADGMEREKYLLLCAAGAALGGVMGGVLYKKFKNK